MYNARVDKSAGLDDVMWIVDMICDDPDLVDYIQEETIKSLEDDYNIILKGICQPFRPLLEGVSALAERIFKLIW